MSTTKVRSNDASESASVKDADTKSIVIHVSNVDRAKEFYGGDSTDANWPDWYAAYIVAERAGGKLPS
jgi:hypothetical protein